MSKKVNGSTFEQEGLQGIGPVLVDFWAAWCAPCHAVAPVLERIADAHNLKLVKVNYDEEQQLAERYGVLSIPNVILFENGEPKAQAMVRCPSARSNRRSAWRRRATRADRALMTV